MVAGAAHLGFSYTVNGSHSLQLQFFKGEAWQSLWSTAGHESSTTLQQKVAVPRGTQGFRFTIHTAGSVWLGHLVVSHLGAGVPPLLSLCGGKYHTCALLSATGQVKCFGSGDNGRLGQGSTQHLGDNPNEMGHSLPVVDLGGAKVLQVACGAEAHHTCALLYGGAVTCWGWNLYGQLGQGHTNDIGDGPDEMGEQLPAVDLGEKAVAVQVVTAQFHTCALLRSGSVKCWGRGGRLGLGDTFGRGDGHGAMGDALPTIDLGNNAAVLQLAAASEHTCALLVGGTITCWGDGAYGRLGQGNTNNIGFGPGEMGEALPPVRLPLRAVQVSARLYHTCALLEDGSAVCWGRGAWGQLGQGSSATLGAAPGEIERLPAIQLGHGIKVFSLVTGNYHTCAVLSDEASMKCWGTGPGNGQVGDDPNEQEVIGDDPGEMGDNLPFVDLGGLRVLQAGAGGYHNCVLLSDDTVRCWGRGVFGQLGTGSSNHVGDGPSEMGDALVPADIFPSTTLADLEDLRLVGGGYGAGWLEVLHNGSWGLVCDDGWTDAAARVVCRVLGLGGGTALSYNVGKGTIVADNVNCLGTELNLRDCTFRGWGVHDCSFQEAAGEWPLKRASSSKQSFRFVRHYVSAPCVRLFGMDIDMGHQES